MLKLFEFHQHAVGRLGFSFDCHKGSPDVFEFHDLIEDAVAVHLRASDEEEVLVSVFVYIDQESRSKTACKSLKNMVSAEGMEPSTY
jgi:hypothetical protein